MSSFICKICILRDWLLFKFRTMPFQKHVMKILHGLNITSMHILKKTGLSEEKSSETTLCVDRFVSLNKYIETKMGAGKIFT